MCEFMFLSNLSYQKVLISGLFSSVAISTDEADAFCLYAPKIYIHQLDIG